MKKLGIVEARKIWRNQIHTTATRKLAALRLLIKKDVINADTIAKFATMPYKQFLATRYWEIIREVIIYRCKNKCVICNSEKQLQVHHRSYEYRGQEHTEEGLANLTTLCRDCHKKFHNK